MDYEPGMANDQDAEEVAPTFSASALKYVKKIITIDEIDNDDEGSDDNLLDEDINEALKNIDEEIQDDDVLED